MAFIDRAFYRFLECKCIELDKIINHSDCCFPGDIQTLLWKRKVLEGVSTILPSPQIQSYLPAV